VSNRGAVALLGLAALVGTAAGGCGATDNGGALGPARNPTGSTLAAGALRSRLPAALARANVLHVGVLPATSPYISVGDDGRSTGLDVELLQEMGRMLGVNVTFTAEAAPALGAGLVSHQLDVIAGGFLDTPSARAQGAHFVDYLRGASAVLVRQGNPAHVTGVADLCGRRVGVPDPTSAAPARAVAACAGKGRPVRLIGPLGPTGLAAGLAGGQFDAVLEDSLTASYAAQASAPPAELAVLDGSSDPVLHGLGLTDAVLAPGLQAALQAAMSDGAYARILARWGAQGDALASASIDGGA
jgi:polar amino acid transport system substrate-binding protein